MEHAFLKQIISIIDDTDDLTIATVREDGFPQATTVSYMNDGMTIFFGTTSDSQKAKNIALNNKVSLTVNRPYKTWDDIVGLSLGGYATAITDSAKIEKVAKLMFEKFPQVAQYASSEDEENVTFFRVTPTVISLLDYRKGFGHTDLVEV